MNYNIESGFLNEEISKIILWAENMLVEFVQSSDERIGLNRCTSKEKEIIQILSKCFMIEYRSLGAKNFIEKTKDTRCPYLCLKDYFTLYKLKRFFEGWHKRFYDNRNEFPKEFQSFKTPPESLNSYEKVTRHKLTNREVEDIQERQSKMSGHTHEFEDSKGNIYFEFQVWKWVL